MKHIVFTGGGTLGHVIPNITLIRRFQELGWDITYIGSKNGLEYQSINNEGIKYITIPTGKLRRYSGPLRNKLGIIGRFSSFKNFIDLFRISFGMIKSFFIIKKIQPNILFSKGGFVAFPPVWGAYMNNIPVIIHESDKTPGLTTKISIPFAKKVCLSFEDIHNKFPKSKTEHTGLPIRELVFNASKIQGLKIASFKKEQKVLLVFGGSSGSHFLNEIVWTQIVKEELNNFNVIHICGKGNVNSKIKKGNYIQFESLNDDFLHVMAASDIVITRGGATSLFELLAMKKAHIIIPLSKKASRGDQIDNAKYFNNLGVSNYIEEENYSWSKLKELIELSLDNHHLVLKKLNDLNLNHATEKILSLLLKESL